MRGTPALAPHPPPHAGGGLVYDPRMADAYHVKLDLFRLGEHLTKAGDTVTRAKLYEALRQWGFIPTPDRGDDWFVAEEISLRALDPTEIVERHLII